MSVPLFNVTWSAHSSKTDDAIVITQVAPSVDVARQDALSFFASIETHRPAYDAIFAERTTLIVEKRNLENTIYKAKQEKKKAVDAILYQEHQDFLERIRANPSYEARRWSALPYEDKEDEPSTEELRASEIGLQIASLYKQIQELEEQIEGNLFFKGHASSVFNYSLTSEVYQVMGETKTFRELIAGEPFVKKFRPTSMIGFYTG